MRLPRLRISVTDDHAVQTAMLRFIDAQRFHLICSKFGTAEECSRAERAMHAAAVEYATQSAAHVIDVSAMPVWTDQVPS